MGHNMADDDRYDYKQYKDKLSKAEAEWIEEFYKEYYFEGISKVPEEKRILNTPEAITEANRNHNSTKTDMLFRAKKDGVLSQLNPNSVDFMNAASDSWEWEDAFKYVGFEGALAVITTQAIRDIKDASVDINITLCRYYEKRERLRKLINRETVKPRGKKK